MEHNYHKLSEIDANIIEAALNAYVFSLKKERESLNNKRIRNALDNELQAVYNTMKNFRESLNTEEE